MTKQRQIRSDCTIGTLEKKQRKKSKGQEENNVRYFINCIVHLFIILDNQVVVQTNLGCSKDYSDYIAYNLTPYPHRHPNGRRRISTLNTGSPLNQCDRHNKNLNLKLNI